MTNPLFASGLVSSLSQASAVSVSPGVAAGGASFLGPASFVVGGLFGAATTASANRAIDRGADAEIAAISDAMGQNDVNTLRNTMQFSRNAQQAVGRLTNNAPDSDSWRAAFVNNVVKGISRDQSAEDEQHLRRQEALTARIMAVEQAAENAKGNPIISFLTGGISGVQTVHALSTAFKGLDAATAAAASTSKLGEAQEQISGLQLDAAELNKTHAEILLEKTREKARGAAANISAMSLFRRRPVTTGNPVIDSILGIGSILGGLE